MSRSPTHHPHLLNEYGVPLGEGLVGVSAPQNQPSKCHKCCKFLGSVISFLFSHVGLFALVVGYCILGAFIFEELERYHELEVKRNVTRTRHAVTDTLWDITR